MPHDAPYDAPHHGPPDGWRDRMGPPDNEVPVAVPLTALLARTDEVAVALVGAQAYTTGIAFRLSTRLRGRAVHASDSAFPPYSDGFFSTGGSDPWDGLLLGVELSDGRTATSLGGGWSREEPSPEQPVLTPRGGGGSDRALDSDYWLSPLPPPGDLLVVVSWARHGLPETTVRLDVTAVREAGGRSTVLWEREPDVPFAPPPPPPPPEGGWFGRAARGR